MKHYCEFVSGTSSKFWEVAVKGTTVTIRYGRIGTAGQSKEKRCATATMATKEAQQLLRKKLKKGYEPRSPKLKTSENSDGSKTLHARKPAGRSKKVPAQKKTNKSGNSTERIATANEAPPRDAIDAATDSLWQALESADLSAVKRALKNQPALDVLRDDLTPLHYAAWKGQAAAAKALLAAGAEVDAVDPAGETALHWTESSELLRVLLSADADPNARDRRGCTALHHFADNPLAVNVLVAAGADPNAQAKIGAPLHFARRDAKAVKALLRAGAELESKDYQGDTPLISAASRGHEVATKALLAAGANVSARNERGQSALHQAATVSSTQCIDLLLAAGADPNARDKDGNTPLHQAAEYNKSANLIRLVAAGAEINATNARGDTALHKVCQHADEKAIKTLLQRGADVNAVDDSAKKPAQLIPARHKALRALLGPNKSESKSRDSSGERRDTTLPSAGARQHLGPLSACLGKVCTMQGRRDSCLPGTQDLYVFDWEALPKDQRQLFEAVLDGSEILERIDEFFPFGLAGHPDDIDESEGVCPEQAPFVRLMMVQPPPVLALEKRSGKVWVADEGSLIALKTKLTSLKLKVAD